MDIRDAAAKYLASRARSTGEMKTHLKSKGYEDGEIAAVIADFLDYGYLDDEDYCRQYIKYAFSKGKGPLRVKQELAKKGISRDTIAFALEDYEMEEINQTKDQQYKDYYDDVKRSCDYIKEDW
jgi:regulatory protein